MLTATAMVSIVAAAYPYLILDLATYVLVAVSFVAVWTWCAPRSRALALVLLGAAAASLASSGEGGWLGSAVVAAGQVIAFLLAARILGRYASLSSFDAALAEIISKAPFRASTWVLWGSYIVSWGFMFTSIPIIYTTVSSRFGRIGWDRSLMSRDLGILLGRSYAAAAIATPMGAIVPVALTVTDVSLSAFLFVAAPISVLIVPFCRIGVRQIRELDGLGTDADADVRTSRATRLLLTLLFLSLTASLVVIAVYEPPALPTITASILLNAVLWGELGRRYALPRSRVRRRLAAFTGNAFPLADGVLLIVSGALAGAALAQTPAIDWLTSFLDRSDSVLVGIALTMGSCVALRVVGMAPPIILLALGPLFNEALDMRAPLTALLLVTSTVLGFLLSPSSISNALVSATTGWTPLEVSLPKQLPYAAVMAFAVAAYVLLLR